MVLMYCSECRNVPSYGAGAAGTISNAKNFHRAYLRGLCHRWVGGSFCDRCAGYLHLGQTGWTGRLEGQMSPDFFSDDDLGLLPDGALVFEKKDLVLFTQ